MAAHTPSTQQKHLAVLIDADNAPAVIIEGNRFEGRKAC